MTGENKVLRRQLQELGERLQILESDNFAQDQALRYLHLSVLESRNQYNSVPRKLRSPVLDSSVEDSLHLIVKHCDVQNCCLLVTSYDVITSKETCCCTLGNSGNCVEYPKS